MDYISKIKAATSVEDLYRLREEFRGIELECNLASKGPDGIDVNAWAEASFHRNAVEKQIAYLETKGVFLADLSAGGGNGMIDGNDTNMTAKELLETPFLKGYRSGMGDALAQVDAATNKNLLLLAAIQDAIKLLTESGGGYAVGEGNIKDAVERLKFI